MANTIVDLPSKRVQPLKPTWKEYLDISLKIISLIATVILAITGLSRIVMFNFYGISLDMLTFSITDSFVNVSRYALLWSGWLILSYIIGFHLQDKGMDFIFLRLPVYLGLLFLGLYCGAEIELFYSSMATLSRTLIFKVFLLMAITIGPLSTGSIARQIIYNSAVENKGRYALKNSKNRFTWICKISAVAVQLICISLFTISMFYITMAGLLSLNLKSKTQYALTQVESQEKVVLFQTNNKLFVADYHTIDGVTTFYTKKYQIIPFQEVELSNITFEEVVVNKEQEKPPQP